MPSISFRPLAVDDLQQVFLWLIRPHVAKGYAKPPNSFMEAVAKYGPRAGAGNAVRAFIVNVDGKDLGYAQAYDVAAFDDYAARLAHEPAIACMDLFLGEEEALGRSVGPRVIDRFVREVVFADPAIRACVAGPGEGNIAARRAFEKAGFRPWLLLRNEGEESEYVMRRDRDDAGLRIEPIDLSRHAQACIDFRRDSYRASFGTEEGCDAEMGADGLFYLEKLRKRMAQVPEGNAHVWHGERLIGQTEMRLEEEPGVGYVNLFYLLPEWRRRGLGWRLHQHAVEVFAKRGMSAMRLSVSRTNEPAIAFYRRLGWRRVGFRPNKETMEILEFRL
jgi:ribosomal protein S18 acetylase RimI-like enzyme